MDLLAAIDLREGGAVRLVQGDFERQSDFGDPVVLARRFLAGGAHWLHVVDLDAARTGQTANRHRVLAIVEAAAAYGVPVQTGGGVRSEAQVEELLAIGVRRVVLGTAALDNPDLALRCARRHPGQVAVGLDYRRRPDGTLEAAAHGWSVGSGRTVGEMLAALEQGPVGAVVVTAIERDGTLSGPDLDGLGEVLDTTGLPVVASGGVGSAADLRRLAGFRSPTAGRQVDGAVAGRALAQGVMTVEEAIAACEPSE